MVSLGCACWCRHLVCMADTAFFHWLGMVQVNLPEVMFGFWQIIPCGDKRKYIFWQALKPKLATIKDDYGAANDNEI